MTNIAAGAFSHCTNLNEVYFEGDAPGLGTTPFSDTPATNYWLHGRAGFTDPFAGRPALTYAPEVYGSGAWLTGITAAQVGAASVESLAALTNGAALGETALQPGAIPAAGCTFLGDTNGPVLTGATVSYLAAPTAAYTLSVDAAAPRYCYAVEILATNACTLGSGLTLGGSWTVTGTNIVTLVPSTGTLWRVYGRGL